ncbi:MAG: response regulator transcription factor, partial [Bacteroidota bacterium]
MSVITIAITDDEVLFRKGLSVLIDDYEDIEVSFLAENGQHLLDQLRTTERLPDALLLDLQMPVLNGVETTKLLQKEFPEIK